MSTTRACAAERAPRSVCDLACKVCGQPGVIRLTIDPQHDMEAHLEYEALAAQLAQSADALRLTQAALDEMRTNFETSAFAAEKARTDLAAAEERVAALEAALDEDHIGRTFHALDGHKRPYGYMQKSEPPDGGTERSDHCRWDARVFLRELLVHPDSTGARE